MFNEKTKKKPGAPFTHLFGKSAVVNLPTVLGMEARDVVFFKKTLPNKVFKHYVD